MTPYLPPYGANAATPEKYFMSAIQFIWFAPRSTVDLTVAILQDYKASIQAIRPWL